MSYKIAKNFWQSRNNYPNYPNVKQRRLIDFNFIMNNTDSVKSIIDLGCADGYLLIALREFTNIELFYGYDISQPLLSKLEDRWGEQKNLITKVQDFTTIMDLPCTDLAISLGMFPYIFESKDLCNILSKIKSKELIIRTPCSMSGNNEYINVFSNELESEYSAVYRTVNNCMEILKLFFKDISVESAYPDVIESKYGTKHFFFVCRERII